MATEDDTPESKFWSEMTHGDMVRMLAAGLKERDKRATELLNLTHPVRTLDPSDESPRLGRPRKNAGGGGTQAPLGALDGTNES